MSVILLLVALTLTGPHTADPGEALYLSGVDHRAAGQLDQALDRLTEVTTTYPDSPFAPAAWLECGRVEEQRGDPAAARARYEQLLARYPSHRVAREATTRLEVLAHQANQDEITASYAQILASYDPQDAVSAMTAVELLVAEYPDHPVVAEAECWLASQARQTGHWDEARERVDRAIAADPDHACILRSLYDMGYDALNHGHLDRAELYFTAMGDHGDFGLQGAAYNLALVQAARRARRVRRAAGSGVSLLVAAGIAAIVWRVRNNRRGTDR